MPSLDEQMEELYGPLAPYADHQRGDHITYRQGENTYTGRIIWVVSPGQVMSQALATRYVVEPDHRQGIPDIVWQSDIVVDP